MRGLGGGEEKCLLSLIHCYCIEYDRFPRRNRVLTKAKHRKFISDDILLNNVNI
jgi:hypothetical protein